VIRGISGVPLTNFSFGFSFLTTMSSKPTLLMLGDPKNTVRWRTTEFETFCSNFHVKGNEDLTRESFKKALQTKKYVRF